MAAITRFEEILISGNDFERLYKLADETISLIGGFTAYLRHNRSFTPNSEHRSPN